MNIAVVLAGGYGNRVGASIPKQYIEILGKPVIVYTLEFLQNNNEIDAIEVVSAPEYIDVVFSYKQKYSISKIRWVTPGGATCQESIRNGVLNLVNIASDSDIIVIILGVAPLISDEVISDSLRVCKKYGNAICGSELYYNISPITNEYWADKYLLKEEHYSHNAPWSIPFGKLVYLYTKNNATDNRKYSYTSTLMIDMGEKLYFSKDSPLNKVKITNKEELDILEGYLLIQELRKGNKDAVNKIRMIEGENIL